MPAEDNKGLSGPVLPASGRLSTLLPTQSVASPTAGSPRLCDVGVTKGSGLGQGLVV